MRRARRCGAGAVLVECEDAHDALGLWRRLDAQPPDAVAESVPGARTVLVVGRIDEALCTALLTLPGLEPEPPGRARSVAIPVRYDGADIDAVAAVTGLSTGDVIERHLAARYTVAFSGFVPGFAYLTGLDPALHVPRHPTPRSRVPRGSVAIADEYTAVYPVASPGGWRLIGTTEAPLFDAQRTPAALLRPGDLVTFERVP